jgi:hypothetical protein
MSLEIRPQRFPPNTPEDLRRAWRAILDRFERLDRAIAAGRVHPYDLASRVAGLTRREDFPAIRRAYSLGLHAAWVRSFEQYYLRWSKLMPGAVVQETEDGQRVTLAEWVLMCEVGIAVQDRDRLTLDTLALELARRFPDSWVTHWAMDEANRLPLPPPTRGMPGSQVYAYA